MNRPKVTRDMVIEAAKDIAKNVNVDAQTIADYYVHHMDGYQIAYAIDRRLHCDFTMSDVEELDGLSG